MKHLKSLHAISKSTNQNIAKTIGGKNNRRQQGRCSTSMTNSLVSELHLPAGIGGEHTLHGASALA
jgi:hypothetical protein